MRANQEKWTREEVILAFELYCLIPKNQDRLNNPRIIRLANALHRTPSAVRLKLQNFKSLDPAYTQDGRRSGLKRVSHLDREIAHEFLHNWAELTYKAHELKAKCDLPQETNLSDVPQLRAEIILPDGKDTQSLKNIRIGQTFFRKALLASYHGRCCISGIKIESLLRSSHIKPWAESDANEKTNPSNGLLLNALFDAAFDKGYISLNGDYEVLVSPQIQNSNDKEAKNIFMPYQGKPINKPNRFLPDKVFIQYHNDVIFLK